MVHGLCRGLDPSLVRPSTAPKSITVEDSFAGCATWEAVRAVLQVRGDGPRRTSSSQDMSTPRVLREKAGDVCIARQGCCCKDDALSQQMGVLGWSGGPGRMMHTLNWETGPKHRHPWGRLSLSSRASLMSTPEFFPEPQNHLMPP